MKRNMLRYFNNVYKNDIRSAILSSFVTINLCKVDENQRRITSALLRHMFPYELKSNKKHPVQKCYSTRRVKNIMHIFECIPESQLLMFYRNLYSISYLGIKVFDKILNHYNSKAYNNIKTIIDGYKLLMSTMINEIEYAQDLLNEIYSYEVNPKMRIFKKDTVNLHIGYYSKEFRQFHDNLSVGNCPFTSHEILYTIIGKCKDYFFRTLPLLNTFLTKIVEKSNIFDYDRLSDEVKLIFSSFEDQDTLKELDNKIT